MKRTFSILLILALLSGNMVWQSAAWEEEDFDHVIRDGVAVITNYSGQEIDVFIPSTLSGVPVGMIEDDVFSGNKYITSVTLPDTLTELVDEQFAWCTALQRVNFGKYTKAIGVSAFAGCTAIREMTIPDSVTRLGAGIFQDCSGLQTLTVGTGVTVLPGDFCNMCTSLRTVHCGDNVTRIGPSAFDGCFWNGGDLYLGKAVTDLPDDALDVDFHGTIHCHRNTALYADLTERGYTVVPYPNDPEVFTVNLQITDGANPIQGSYKKKIGLFSAYRKNPVQLGITGIEKQYIRDIAWRVTEGGFRVQDGMVTHTGWFAATGVVQVTVTDVNGQVHTASQRIVFYRFNLQMLLRFAKYR